MLEKLGNGWCAADANGDEFRTQTYVGNAAECAARCLAEGRNCIGYWQYVSGAYTGKCNLLARFSDWPRTASGLGTSSMIYDRQDRGFAPGPDALVVVNPSPGQDPLECWVSRPVRRAPLALALAQLKPESTP